MYLSFKVTSKNKTSLSNFFNFIMKLEFPIKIVKNAPKNKKKVFLSVLKSPHVNKDAQEQFEFKTYSKNLTIWSTQLNLLILILKKAIKTSFPGVQIKIYYLINNKTKSKFLLKILNIKNLNVNFFNDRVLNKIILNKKINFYLNLTDCYGELSYKIKNITG